MMVRNENLLFYIEIFNNPFNYVDTSSSQGQYSQRQTALVDCVHMEAFSEQCISVTEPHIHAFVPATFSVVNIQSGFLLFPTPINQ